MAHPCDRILVVNDEHDIVESLAEALRAEGAIVETAVGVETALRIIEHGFAPSVVLTDLMMPGRTGKELIEELRHRPATRAVPIVAMSASSMLLERVDETTNARLAKPFSLETLYSTLASVC